MNAPQEVFAAWLKAERKRAGMSQDKLVTALQHGGHKIRQTQISRIERGGRPLSLNEAGIIAAVFGATLGDIFGAATPDAEMRALASRRTAVLYELKATIAAELAVTS